MQSMVLARIVKNYKASLEVESHITLLMKTTITSHLRFAHPSYYLGMVIPGDVVRNSL